MFKRMRIYFKKSAISFLIAAFLTNLIVPAGAQTLPVPGTSVGLSVAFNPPVLLGLQVHPENPLLFDFIVDPGTSKLSEVELKAETEKLVKYFLAALTIPEKEVWVNLSPYEKDRIVPDVLGQTTMGKTMLEQDYLLKQLASSLTNPDEELGRKFWTRVKDQTRIRLGVDDIPMNTFNKVWIVPRQAEVLESQGIVIIENKRLKVMMEQDYLAMENNSGSEIDLAKDAGRISSEIFKDTIVPSIEKEVNEGRNFAGVRQIYNSVILAAWYKQALKESLLGKIYTDKGKVAGVESGDQEMKQRIYDQYLAAFKKGVYNLIKEDEDTVTGEVIPRKYFSGGFAFVASSVLVRRAVLPNQLDIPNGNPNLAISQVILREDDNGFAAGLSVKSPEGLPVARVGDFSYLFGDTAHGKLLDDDPVLRANVEAFTISVLAKGTKGMQALSDYLLLLRIADNSNVYFKRNQLPMIFSHMQNGPLGDEIWRTLKSLAKQRLLLREDVRSLAEDVEVINRLRRHAQAIGDDQEARRLAELAERVHEMGVKKIDSALNLRFLKMSGMKEDQFADIRLLDELRGIMERSERELARYMDREIQSMDQVLFRSVGPDLVRAVDFLKVERNKEAVDSLIREIMSDGRDSPVFDFMFPAPFREAFALIFMKALESRNAENIFRRYDGPGPVYSMDYGMIDSQADSPDAVLQLDLSPADVGGGITLSDPGLNRILGMPYFRQHIALFDSVGMAVRKDNRGEAILDFDLDLVKDISAKIREFFPELVQDTGFGDGGLFGDSRLKLAGIHGALLDKFWDSIRGGLATIRAASSSAVLESLFDRLSIYRNPSREFVLNELEGSSREELLETVNQILEQKDHEIAITLSQKFKLKRPNRMSEGDLKEIIIDYFIYRNGMGRDDFMPTIKLGRDLLARLNDTITYLQQHDPGKNYVSPAVYEKLVLAQQSLDGVFNPRNFLDPFSDFNEPRFAEDAENLIAIKDELTTFFAIIRLRDEIRGRLELPREAVLKIIQDTFNNPSLYSHLTTKLNLNNAMIDLIKEAVLKDSTFLDALLSKLTEEYLKKRNSKVFSLNFRGFIKKFGKLLISRELSDDSTILELVARYMAGNDIDSLGIAELLVQGGILMLGQLRFAGDEKLKSLNRFGDQQLKRVDDMLAYFGYSRKIPSVSQASSNALSGPDRVGGIDFDASKVNLQIKRDGKGVPLPLPEQNLEMINIDGFIPVIINIQPINAKTLPVFLGQSSKESGEELNLSRSGS